MEIYGKCVCGFESSDANDFEIHEVKPEVTVAFCKSCAKVLELDAGK